MSGPELATTRLAGAAGHLPLHLVLPKATGWAGRSLAEMLVEEFGDLTKSNRGFRQAVVE